MSQKGVKEEGFSIFKDGLLRILSPTHYLAKSTTAGAWQLVELKEGKRRCDCNADGTPCSHLYAAELHRYTSRHREQGPDASHLKCRYCGSIDVAGCGYRYGARGISRRLVCRDCLRKFSIPYVQANPGSKPDELTWVLNEVGLLITRLHDLVSALNLKVAS